ncbi:MAG: Rieske 2Fe-2S domain-containing protein [Candidatus Obscuribacterales bacterium]|nr:Rieske 2Fe-2S domain-containing protein [Candidatus Obscuribacterales bacterium]
MVFVKLADSTEVEEGCMKVYKIQDRNLLLVNSDGFFYALENRCPHIGKPLSTGTLKGCTLTCAYHNAEFDIRDGANCRDARILFLSMACKNAVTFPIKVENEWIMVDLQ